MRLCRAVKGSILSEGDSAREMHPVAIRGVRKMPKRVLDFDALWASDKLASCAEWAQSEYAWLYGLADASGSFEITNLRVIWGRVAAIRKNLTLERLQEIFDEFIARGLLFTWEENGKRYAHWTGSDVPGRLPRRSWRMRLEKLAPPVPCEALAAYSARFGGSKETMVARTAAGSGSASDARPPREAGHECDERQARFTHEREEAHAQDWDLGLDEDLDEEIEIEKQVCPARPISVRASDRAEVHMQRRQLEHGPAEKTARESDFTQSAAEELLAIYDAERGELPAAGAMTCERRRRCARWLAGGFTEEEFRAAVRRAAGTPFLTGDGSRGWQASFDWLIANRSNARKVLQGEYAPQGRGHAAKAPAERRGLADLYTGMAPRPADCGVRVNPAALERIRARQAQSHAQDARAAGALDLARIDDVSRVSGAAPDLAPKPVAFDAQARAAPAAAISAAK
jgi:hypothetical protein